MLISAGVGGDGSAAFCGLSDLLAAILVSEVAVAYVVAVVFPGTNVRSTRGCGEALVAVPLLALRSPVGVAAFDRGAPVAAEV